MSLVFVVRFLFGDASKLEVFYSTDWDGTVSTLEKANWEPLPAQLANRNSESRCMDRFSQFCNPEAPTFYLAFVYSGSGKTTSDGTYEIDDIRIIEK